MRITLILMIAILTACGGTLTDDQRKKVKQDMKDHAIKKVSEADITEAAFTIGFKSIEPVVAGIGTPTNKSVLFEL